MGIVLLTLLMLTVALYGMDVVIVLVTFGLRQFTAPNWTSLPGGLTYWIVVLDGHSD